MPCVDKPYGLRRVWISEEVDGQPDEYNELICQSIEVPKVFAEDVEVDQTSGLRFATAHLSGNLNELTGTITITMPKNKADMKTDAIKALFKAAGLQFGNNKYTLQNTGACGNTFSLYCLDRAGILAEQLHGCIITSIDATLNRSDAPTLSFAYQAARKEELWANHGVDGSAFPANEAEVTTATGAHYNDGANDENVSFVNPFSVDIIDSSGTNENAVEVSAYNPTSGLTYGRDNATDHTGHTLTIKPRPIDDAVTPWAYCGIRGWDVVDGTGSLLPYKLQSASFTYTTGMSYGELIVGHNNLSEVLVGGAELTGSSTVYVDTTIGATHVGNFGNGGIQIKIGDWSVKIPGCYLTETPDLSLAKNEPASGDLAWKAYGSYDGAFIEINCN